MKKEEYKKYLKFAIPKIEKEIKDIFGSDNFYINEFVDENGLFIKIDFYLNYDIIMKKRIQLDIEQRFNYYKDIKIYNYDGIYFKYKVITETWKSEYLPREAFKELCKKLNEFLDFLNQLIQKFIKFLK